MCSLTVGMLNLVKRCLSVSEWPIQMQSHLKLFKWSAGDTLALTPQTNDTCSRIVLYAAILVA